MIEYTEEKGELLAALIAMTKEGNAPAAGIALKIINELETQAMSLKHKNAISDCKSNAELCRYLGQVGESKNELPTHIGCTPGDLELTAYKTGIKERKLEIKAIELARAKRGSGDVEDWMR